MESDDERKTISMLSAQSTKIVGDLIPEGGEQPPFEVDVERTTLVPSKDDDSMPYRMLELTTERRKYIIDSTFRCIEIIDRKSRQIDPAHPCNGARLVGGQRRYGKTIHQVKPFPIIGTTAVFEKPAPDGKGKAVQVTSKVVRVVFKVRISSAILDPDDPFDEVTNAMLLPKR